MSDTAAEIERESKPNQLDAPLQTAIADDTTHAKEAAQEEQAPDAIATVEETTRHESPASSPPQTTATTAPEPVEQPNLPANVRILKEAFPDTDVEVIEAVLQSQNDHVESTFEILLGMSDPSYSAPTPAPVAAEQAPPMPPRPQSRRNSNDAPYAYWERQAQPEPTSVEEQLRMDEELAKKLAMEDERRSQQQQPRRRSSQQGQYQQQSQRQRDDDDDDSLFNLQEELPIIKEKMKEAGNAAKKKMMDLYNQFKANTQKSNPQNQNETAAASSMPTTNAQYRGLPSDDGDDLLTGDISALHLSDYDVYAKTSNRPAANDHQRGDDTIYVNPPVGSPTHNLSATSTSDAQLKADEDFARQLAQEEQIEARRLRHSSAAVEDTTLHAPQMPTRKPVNPTVVIAPRSPLEFEGDSDYEDIGLTAANTTQRSTNLKNTNADENASVPYVIGDDDDSDSDDLVDIDDDAFKDEDDEQEKKGTSASIQVDFTREGAATTTAKSSDANATKADHVPSQLTNPETTSFDEKPKA
ncbi:hypothetical protein MAM1_0266c08943 [Mucor ambiguus]|uniref:CUE domain-containing protein n=1 Tax=Mucor ambiguus TaxID=91626 RepID=A0A0C9MFC4_9FUNG|nr:hypothetical protein MAM1_0266c08943 [Mucor ambiguus]